MVAFLWLVHHQFQYGGNSLSSFTRLSKSPPNTRQDSLQPIILYSIESHASFPAAAEQSAILHHPKVLRGHMALNLASLGQIPYSVLRFQKQLDHSQPVRVGKRSQALRRARQRLKPDWLLFAFRHN